MRRKWLAALLIFLGLLAALAAAAWLSQERRTEQEAARIAEVMALRPGMVVADVGAGKGRFSVTLAQRVGRAGRVYSTEISPGLLQDIRKAAARAGLGNVTVLEGAERETNLPPACCDAILLRTVYHHLTRPEAINASLLRALRPGGLLVVIDFAPRRWLSWIARDVPKNRNGHGIPLPTLIQELTRAGFQQVRSIEPWTKDLEGETYCALFRRPM